MQPPHVLGGADVDRVLRLDDLRLIARDETEQAHVFVEVGEREFAGASLFQVVQAETAKVADQHVARQIALLDAGEIIHRLTVGALKILAERFHLDQQDARPEGIHITPAAIVFFRRMLKTGKALVGNAEDFEECDQERLGLCVLIGRVRPVF